MQSASYWDCWHNCFTLFNPKIITIMLLLDIAYPGRPYRRPVIPDTVKPIKTEVHPDPTDTITSANDTVVQANDTVVQTNDSISAFVGNFGSTAGNDDSSTLLWSVLVVLFALCLCFYFVLSYRRMQTKCAG